MSVITPMGAAESVGVATKFKRDGITPLVVVGAGDYTVLPGEKLIECDDTAAARTITLPARKDVPIGESLLIKDGSGAAGVNRITINAAGSDTIDGATSVVLGTNYGVVALIASDDGWISVQGVRGQMVQIGEKTLSGGSVAAFGFSSLAVLGAKKFRIEYELNVNAGSHFLRINGADTNISSDWIYGEGAAVGSVAADTSFPVATSAAANITNIGGWAEIDAATGMRRYMEGKSSEFQSGAVNKHHRHHLVGGWYNDTATAIDALTVEGGAGTILDGSKARLFARF